MNPLVRLVLALLLGAAWFVVTRVFNSSNKAVEENPAGRGRRREISNAIRMMAFFALIWFISSTIIIFLLGCVVTLFSSDPRSFWDAFTDNINSSADNTSGPLAPSTLVGALATLLATVAAIWISQNIARFRSIVDLGLRPYKGIVADVALGLFLGVILFTLIFQVENAVGFIKATPGPTFNWLALLSGIVICLCIAIAEELVVRGYFLQIINETWGGTAALVITSVFWGFAHLLNPRATLFGVLNIIVAGLLFGYAYSITGKLWLPIALHFSWNFAQGIIFGFPVSGYLLPNPVFQPLVDGPSEFTGGLFGPEGGLVLLIAIIVAAAVLYGWGRLRNPQPQKS